MLDINFLIQRVEDLEAELQDMLSRVQVCRQHALINKDWIFQVSLEATMRNDIQKQQRRVAWAYLNLVRAWRGVGEASYEDYKQAEADYYASVDACEF